MLDFLMRVKRSEYVKLQNAVDRLTKENERLKKDAAKQAAESRTQMAVKEEKKGAK